jgi:hypothetical protein
MEKLVLTTHRGDTHQMSMSIILPSQAQPRRTHNTCSRLWYLDDFTGWRSSVEGPAVRLIGHLSRVVPGRSGQSNDNKDKFLEKQPSRTL